MTRASDNEYPSVLLDEQASAPTTPATGFWRVYAKSDGLYIVDDAGTETGPLSANGGGGGAGLELVSEVEVTGAVQTNIDFSSIDQTGTHLMIMAMLRTDRVATQDQLGMQVGNTTLDTGANYDSDNFDTTGASTLTSGDTKAHPVRFGIAGGSETTGVFGFALIEIPFYTNTNFHKVITGYGGFTSGTNGRRAEGTSRWASTAAIDEIRLFSTGGDDFEIGSIARLYKKV